MPHVWVILTGPSCAGKDSFAGALREHFPNAGKVLTSTTRLPRQGEEQGVAYNFYTREEFDRRYALGEFIEQKEVHDCLYGTRHEDLALARERHEVVISIIDPFGARDMLRQFPDVRTVFVDAPKEELVRRLKERGESTKNIATRMATRNAEILLKDEFTLYLPNVVFAKAERVLIREVTLWCASNA